MKYCLYKRLQQNPVNKELLMEMMLEQVNEDEKMENSIIGDIMELLSALNIRDTKRLVYL